jgi:hypothetical protein
MNHERMPTHLPFPHRMVTLLMSAATSNLADQSWYRTLFVTVPSFVSLDFVSAFGKAILWFWVFTAIAGFVVYELYRFTGGWDGLKREKRDEGEGFDREDKGNEKKKRWRNSYGYKMGITFVATSLYLPLSKVSIAALFWTADFWVRPLSLSSVFFSSRLTSFLVLP